MSKKEDLARKTAEGDNFFSSIFNNKANDKAIDILTDYMIPAEEKVKPLEHLYPDFIDAIPDHAKATKDKARQDYGIKVTPEKAPRGEPESNAGAQKYMQLFNKHHRPEMNVLFKPEKDITEAEILAASKFSNYESKDYALNDRVQKKVKGWYEQNYGTQPVRRDATGRQIDPEPKFKLPEQEIPVRTKDGSVMEEGLSKLARKMAEIDADETPDTGVSALQKSLNRLGYVPELKEDGKLGPKTSLQTRAYLAENGLDKVFQALNRKVYL